MGGLAGNVAFSEGRYWHACTPELHDPPPEHCLLSICAIVVSPHAKQRDAEPATAHTWFLPGHALVPPSTQSH